MACGEIGAPIIFRRPVHLLPLTGQTWTSIMQAYAVCHVLPLIAAIVQLCHPDGVAGLCWKCSCPDKGFRFATLYGWNMAYDNNGFYLLYALFRHFKPIISYSYQVRDACGGMTQAEASLL